MKFYVELFDKQDETLQRYIKTTVVPEQIVQIYGEHPVGGSFELTEEIAQRLGCDLDFANYDCYITACRDYVGEGYEYNGEVLYPPPMFLPESFNALPVKPKKS